MASDVSARMAFCTEQVCGQDDYHYWDEVATRLLGRKEMTPLASPSDVIELIWSVNPAGKDAYILRHGPSISRGRAQPGHLWAGGDDDLFCATEGRRHRPCGRGKPQQELKDNFCQIIRDRCLGCGILEWVMDSSVAGTREAVLEALRASQRIAQAAGIAHGNDADNHRLRREGYEEIIQLLISGRLSQDETQAR